MNQISQPLKPASIAETSAALQLLFDALPFQRGAKTDNVAAAYVEALRGMTAEAIEAGIRRFLRGEVEGVSPRFVPTPPELARIVRTAVVPERIPEPRRIAPSHSETPGERARMLLKMPMFNHAFSTGQMDELARAHREGQGAMIVLALKWGIEVPQELLDLDEETAEQEWRQARNRAIAEMERNPPPFLRALRERKRREQQIEQEDAA